MIEVNWYEKMVKKASISFRVGINSWLPETRFRELLSIFKDYGGVTDEIALFTAETHSPLPLEVFQERARVAADRIRSVKTAGLNAGINVLATLSHHEENLPNSLSGEYTPMTDIDGKICLGSFCPTDKGVQNYVKQIYESAAAANPDFIWIDDDVRLANHRPIKYACFCDACLAIFAKETGKSYTRKTLKESFNNGTAGEKMEIRQAWLKHNRSTITGLLEIIEKAVHGIKPGISLGLMTGDRFEEGYDLDNWARVLSGPDGSEVRWRPGGGFYTDRCPVEVMEKADTIGRQVSVLPKDIVLIQSEVENFTYQRLQKSERITALESAVYIAAGCTGTAFNVLSLYDEPLTEYRSLIKTLQHYRPFFDLLAGTTAGTETQGIRTVWNKDSYATSNLSEGEWFGEDSGFWKGLGICNEMLQIGISPAYSLDGSQAAVLTGQIVPGLKKEEILKILSSGLYMDGEALERLNEMGYGDLTGFTVEDRIDKDCLEEFTGDPLNGRFAGHKRDARQSFWWRQSAVALKPVSKQCRILAKGIDYAGREIFPCCIGVFENRLGGRVCTAGYYPWKFLQNLSKSSQIKAVMRWISRDNLPAYVSSYHRIGVWIRKLEANRLAVILLNTSLDEAEGVKLSVLTGKKEAQVFDMACRESKSGFSGSDEPYRVFPMPPIPSWQIRLVLI
ncbi:MAG: hypothetical protein V2A65_02740 [Candidatus Omnitrophota bacterium]